MLRNELTDSIRTIFHVADHFQRLKEQARYFLDEFRASERGFFLPSEQERVQQLLVSYWHSRNALFELVLENRDYEEGATEQECYVRFLVAFAGALVLIDAARFLRESVHDRPVVREKLNEAEPNFHIPAGVYDQIQRSLTSPVHAWHLYHALQYLRENQRCLRALAESDSVIEQLWDLIGELRRRLKVGLDSLLIARLRARGTQVRTHVGRDLLFRAMYGLQKVFSQLLSEKYVQLGHRPMLPADIVAVLRAQLCPGDVLVTRKEFALTNYFLPGFWPHAALYLGQEGDLERMRIDCQFDYQAQLGVFRSCGPDDEGRVLEALKDGVRLRPVSTPLSCDAIAVLRPRLSPEEIGDALARGFRYVGRPYDFDFDFTRSDRLVCTEVVYRSYEGLGGIGFALIRRAGRLTLSAEDLLGMALRCEGFQVVGAFAPGLSPDFKLAQEAERILAATMARP